MDCLKFFLLSCFSGLTLPSCHLWTSALTRIELVWSFELPVAESKGISSFWAWPHSCLVSFSISLKQPSKESFFNTCILQRVWLPAKIFSTFSSSAPYRRELILFPFCGRGIYKDQQQIKCKEPDWQECLMKTGRRGSSDRNVDLVLNGHLSGLLQRGLNLKSRDPALSSSHANWWTI